MPHIFEKSEYFQLTFPTMFTLTTTRTIRTVKFRKEMTKEVQVSRKFHGNIISIPSCPQRIQQLFDFQGTDLHILQQY